MKLHRTRWKWLAAVAGTVLGVAGSSAPPPAIAGAEVDIRRDAVVAAIERVTPSVVNIRTAKLVRRNDPYETIFRRFYGLEEGDDQSGDIGSGVIIDAFGDEGYILTNVHVVQRADRVQVQLWDGREYEAEILLWMNQKDLALLKIVRRPGDAPFRPIAMALDDDLLLGETVIAVGNPFGLGGSVSRGILSSKNRRPDSGGQKLAFPDWLQTDADINPGNSGGALINIRGELIGINVATYSPNQAKGTGFAIPVKQISSALTDFFTLEWSSKLWLGARFRGTPFPVTVREVQKGSPADRAGLRVGQQVLEVNGRPVASLAGLNHLVADGGLSRPTLTVLENGKRRPLTLELVPLVELNRELISRRIGLAVTPISEAQAAAYGLSAGEGLLIGDVEKNSPAAAAQLQAGMVVTGLNGFSVADLANVSNVLGNARPGEPVQLTVKVVNRYGGSLARVMTGQVDVAVR